MEKLRIMSVFGTRPEAIKMAPLVKELASRDEIESLCCVTAQHREMLDSVMEVFDLKADCDLDIMTPRQTLSTITSKCLLGMDDAIEIWSGDEGEGPFMDADAFAQALEDRMGSAFPGAAESENDSNQPRQ